MGAAQHVGISERLPEKYCTIVLYFLAASVGEGGRSLLLTCWVAKENVYMLKWCYKGRAIINSLYYINQVVYTIYEALYKVREDYKKILGIKTY